MTTAQLIFLYTAEERSISRAAARAFVSQQCASRHIANLENQYGTPLVIRKPVFGLTEAGEVLAASLRRMLVLEQETTRYIEDISEGTSGRIAIGINSTRAAILFPKILPQYRKQYPHVKIVISSGDTKYLVSLLKKGELDMIVGVNLSYDPQFEVLPMTEDRIFFLTTRSQLQTFLPERAGDPQINSPISITEINRFPLCRNLSDSTMTELLDRVSASQNIPLDGLYQFSDYYLQVRFCGAGLASSFCTEMVLPLVYAWNSMANANKKEEKVLVFPIEDFTDTLRIDLIRKRESIRPSYANAFARLLMQTSAE